MFLPAFILFETVHEQGFFFTNIASLFEIDTRVSELRTRLVFGLLTAVRFDTSLLQNYYSLQ